MLFLVHLRTTLSTLCLSIPSNPKFWAPFAKSVEYVWIVTWKTCWSCWKKKRRYMSIFSWLCFWYCLMFWIVAFVGFLLNPLLYLFVNLTITVCFRLERMYGVHSPGKTKQWSMQKIIHMFMFSVTKFTWMDKGGSLFQHMKSFGRGWHC